MDINEIPQPVTIKIPFSDEGKENFVADVPLSWSIRRLKQHLEENLPRNPKADGQKLILSGRILQDELLLKDCLKTVQGALPVIHLVYSRSPGFSASEATAPVHVDAQEGLRRRAVPENGPADTAAPTSPQSVPVDGSYDFHAQMMQNYQSYMQNYMMGWSQMVQPGAMPFSYNMPPFPMAPQYPAAPQNQTFFPQPPPHRHNHFAILHLPDGIANQVNAIPADAVNAQPVNVEPPAHRDFLDWANVLTRVVLLLCVIYFYSTTTRFFSAFTMLTLILLFNTVRDFRRWRERHQRQQQQQRGTPEPTPLAEQQGENQNANAEEGNPAARIPEQQGLISTVVSIVVGFITSLVPDNVGQVVAN